MGGLVSALAAARRQEDVRALVLWYPAFGVPDGARRRYEAGEKEVFGLRLGEDFDREAKDIDVYGTIPAYGGPVLMIHGDQDAVVPIGYSERALSIYRDARLTVIPGAGHGYDGADSVAAREYSIDFSIPNCTKKCKSQKKINQFFKICNKPTCNLRQQLTDCQAHWGQF